MSGTTAEQARGGLWVLLPQAASRLSAVYVFAVVANQVDAQRLGVLSISTAVTAGAFGLVPAVVGKPLAVLGAGLRQERGRQAQSFAVLAGLAAGALLTVAAFLSDGLVQLALVACALGVPAACVVESRYWRTVFVRGRPRAGSGLAAVYACQVAVVTAAALWLGPDGVVLAPFAGLAFAAAVLLVADRGASWQGARAWATVRRQDWLPYVVGVSAAVLLVQAVPVVLAATAGLAAASVYRAGELVFGGTNLLIGVVAQTLLTEDGQNTATVRRSFRTCSVALVGVAVANGVVVALLPEAVLRALVGPVADDVQRILPLLTVQRLGMGVAYVGSVLLVRFLAARRVGTLGALSAGLNLALLVAGAALGGVQGGVAGLALAEAVVAVYYVRLVRAVR